MIRLLCTCDPPHPRERGGRNKRRRLQRNLRRRKLIVSTTEELVSRLPGQPLSFPSSLERRGTPPRMSGGECRTRGAGVSQREGGWLDGDALAIFAWTTAW